MIADPLQLYRLLATPVIELAKMPLAGDEVVSAMRKYVEEENMPVLCHTKENIGAYMTTGDRLKLYKYLHKERGMYCETDSVIYVRVTGQFPVVTCGNMMGDMIRGSGPEVLLRILCMQAPNLQLQDREMKEAGE